MQDDDSTSLTTESNPMFNPGGSGDFRPSLYVILEDLRESREASSYFREESVEAKQSSGSSHSSGDNLTSGGPLGKGDMESRQMPQRRLSARLSSSLARMIRTPSGRGLLHTDEEKSEETELDDRRIASKKRGSLLLPLFNKT